MTQPLKHVPDTLPKPILPAWIMQSSAFETAESAAFASGSGLALLHVVLHDPTINVPSELLRNRLALRAATHCLKLEGRMQTEADIRDAYLLTAAGDAMGPAGDMLALWQSGSSISFRHAGWRERLNAQLPEDTHEYFPDWMDQADDLQGIPVAKAASLLSKVIQMSPKQEAVALLCAGIILARSLGWNSAFPLFGLHLKRDALRTAAKGEDILIACHAAVAHGSQDTMRLAHDLARRAGRLRAIAPKLRSKGSLEAFNLFLTEDAVFPPNMLSPLIKGSNVPMTDRSARRLCDRLVELGVVKELTGRASFRLYGVA